MRNFGFDLHPERVAESRANARREGTEVLVTILRKDVMSLDLSPATVVTLYLPDHVHARLGERIEQEVRRGTRVVSHGMDFGDWDRAQVVQADGPPELIYLRRVGSTNRGVVAKAPGEQTTPANPQQQG